MSEQKTSSILHIVWLQVICLWKLQQGAILEIKTPKRWDNEIYFLCYCDKLAKSFTRKIIFHVGTSSFYKDDFVVFFLENYMSAHHLFARTILFLCLIVMMYCFVWKITCWHIICLQGQFLFVRLIVMMYCFVWKMTCWHIICLQGQFCLFVL